MGGAAAAPNIPFPDAVRRISAICGHAAQLTVI
jgi:hypothetical protein